MKVVYTRHAKNRMRERGVSRQEVQGVLDHPDRQEIVESNRFHYFRHIGPRYIRVTCAVEHTACIIISVVDKSD